MTLTLIPPILRLDDVHHRAFLGDRELVRVTTALADVGIIDTQWFTDSARLRGSYLHEAIALHHAGELAEDSIDPVLQPYWAGYVAFLADSAFQALGVEQPICDELAGYAGRYDLFGQFPHLPPTAYDLIDVKTGRAPNWTALQTALYRRCLRIADAPIVRCRRWALELPGNNRYRLLSLNLHQDQSIDRAADQRHEQAALAAVTVANWKRGTLR
jgi:hypothetical protein